MGVYAFWTIIGPLKLVQCKVLKYPSSTIFLVLGDIMQLINQLGIANNTLIIFTSDNGAALVSRQKGMPIKYHVLCLKYLIRKAI